MIFVTVGTQLPFPRLISAMDAWSARNPETHVIAQTGEDVTETPNLEARTRVDASEFTQMVSDCELLVAHAGMGSILTALDLGKPVIVMPRQAALGEHRNDHQLATAQKFGHLANLQVVSNADELDAAINAFQTLSAQTIDTPPASATAKQLLDEVRAFVMGEGESATQTFFQPALYPTPVGA